MATFGVKDLQERFAVGEHTVLGWIRRGELRAINVGRKTDGRPKWRITPEALNEFELLRSATPPAKATRRRKQPNDVVEFIK
jgi:transposase